MKSLRDKSLFSCEMDGMRKQALHTFLIVKWKVVWKQHDTLQGNKILAYGQGYKVKINYNKVANNSQADLYEDWYWDL